MKRTCWILPVVCLVGLGLGSATYAGNNSLAKMAIHIKVHGTSCTEGFPIFTNCAQINTTYPNLGDIDVIPVFFELNEYVEVGISMDWPAEWGTMSWVRCSGDGQIGTLVNPNTYARIYWNTCQHTAIVAPGYGWLNASARGFVASSYLIRSRVFDCAPTPEMDWACMGWSAVGGWIGDDACTESATEQSTWGRIKAIFSE